MCDHNLKISSTCHAARAGHSDQHLRLFTSYELGVANRRGERDLQLGAVITEAVTIDVDPNSMRSQCNLLSSAADNRSDCHKRSNRF